MKKLFVLGLLLLIYVPSTQAFEGTYNLIIKKQEEKKRSRWTLSDWLIQKEKIRAMDMWLAINTKEDPFEFYLQGMYTDLDRDINKTIESFKTSESSLTANVTLLGLRYGYIDAGKDYFGSEGLVKLRIFGTSDQNTHISVAYGRIDYNEQGEIFKNPFYQGDLAIYLNKYIGIGGTYRQFVKQEGTLNTELEGDVASYRLFIDYGIFRIFAEQRNDIRKYTNGGGTTEKKRSGIFGGLAIFF